MTKTLVPLPRFNKRDIFKEHNDLLKVSNSKLLLIGDSLVANLYFFPDIWNEYFSYHDTINLGVGGDKTQNVLWRIENMVSPKNVSHVFLLCGSNNLDTDTAEDIAQGIILCGVSAKRKIKDAIVTVLPLLPRDKFVTARRDKILLVNEILQKESPNNKLRCIPFSENDWLYDNRELNISLYHSDYLHLSKHGNRKLSSAIIKMYRDHTCKKEELCISKSEIQDSQLDVMEFPPLPVLEANINIQPPNQKGTSYNRTMPKISGKIKTSSAFLSKCSDVSNVSYSRVCSQNISVRKSSVLPVSNVVKYPNVSHVCSVKPNHHKCSKQIVPRHCNYPNKPLVSTVKHSNPRLCKSETVVVKCKSNIQSKNVVHHVNLASKNVVPSYVQNEQNHQIVKPNVRNMTKSQANVHCFPNRKKHNHCPVNVHTKNVQSKYVNVHNKLDHLDKKVVFRPVLKKFLLFSSAIYEMLLLFFFIYNFYEFHENTISSPRFGFVYRCRTMYSIDSCQCMNYGNFTSDNRAQNQILKVTVAGSYFDEQFKDSWHTLKKLRHESHSPYLPKGKLISMELHIILLFIIILLRIKRKIKRNHLISLFYLVIMKLITFKLNSYEVSFYDDLKLCNKKSFFSIDVIKTSDRLHTYELKKTSRRQ